MKKIISTLISIILTLSFAYCITQPDIISSDVSVGKELVSHFIDVGQGDSAFIELPDEKCMLIDAGERGNEEKIISYIKNLGYAKIDFLICTHPHSDHIGSMTDVIREFEVENIYMPKKSHTSSVYIELLKEIKEQGKKVKQVKSGVEIINDEGLKISFVSPVKDYDEINNASAVVRIDYYDSSFLFTGDIENDAIEDITENIDVDVLKVSHHGSSNATSKEFLKRVSPEYAVISCGENNPYGHPHRETLSFLKSFSVKVYRTDLMGDIVVATDGENYDIKAGNP